MLLRLPPTGQESVLLVTKVPTRVICALDPLSATVPLVKLDGMPQDLPQPQPVVPVVILSVQLVLDHPTPPVNRASRPCTSIKVPLVWLIAQPDSSKLLKKLLFLVSHLLPERFVRHAQLTVRLVELLIFARPVKQDSS